MKNVFLDANILLEILFDRKLARECERVVSDPANNYVVSALTVHIVWYMAERYKIHGDLVDDLLSVWKVASITEQIVIEARGRYDGRDFEDCLQSVCAESYNCDEIITIKHNFKKNSQAKIPVKVLS